MNRRIIIAGTGSSSGKSTVALGLMGAFRKQGLTVQGFKCGPDYIDPSYHTAITGRSSRNLDSWMLTPAVLREIYARGSRDADISIIEGVMGMFDGKSARSDEGSTAEVGALLGAPVLLVVDVSGMGRSAAAVVKGFQAMAGEGVRIAGVIANRTGSQGHGLLIRQAVEQKCGIPVVGCLMRNSGISIPERHLGLIPSLERGDLAPLFQSLAAHVAAGVDLEAVWRLAEAPELEAGSSLFPDTACTAASKPDKLRIAVARDAAFHFYYPENLELLEHYGAELIFFSPLAGELLPKHTNGLYFGGGFPEEYAGTLAQHRDTARSIRSAVEDGLPVIAECGGFMYLCRSLTQTDGSVHEMAGVFPGKTVMQTQLAAMGYREAAGAAGNPLLPEGQTARGHEFHYSVYVPEDGGQAAFPHAYTVTGRKGAAPEGFLYKNTVAGYTHLHFASNPIMVERWLAFCRSRREE
ncbi:cobyrinate a,c-diamide synthase [Paenibacillus sp. YN15]|uniref:cobyrinate a,c-diamide synthase n=1 Tax=Paenibacillus sp. YN15 TaxID=1742774 RepID=UPI000DCD54ED|nr:cobyrinate a,c-diamide synthase [Paenibacillus sp. YN15]RAV00238.1 cobyrinic acid a,c-diamide synthase [Paenibacillus sp. YN15]